MSILFESEEENEENRYSSEVALLTVSTFRSDFLINLNGAHEHHDKYS